MARSLSPSSHRGRFTRAALGLFALIAVPLAAGCASLGPSVRDADNASVDLAHQQIRTSDLQIMQGLLIQPAQLGASWRASSVSGTAIGEAGLNACGVGLGTTGETLTQQEVYHQGDNWLVNQVVVYNSADNANKALGSIGGTSAKPFCLTTDAVGKPQPPGTANAQYVINGASVEPNWFSPAAGLIAPASGGPGTLVSAKGGGVAVVGQARGPFVSVVYGPAQTNADNVPQDPEAVTLAGAALAYQQLDELTDADVGGGS